MSEGIKKFEELMKTDEVFKEKLKKAMDSYDGEKTQEAIFDAVLTPLAEEYGISATIEELKQYSECQELSEDEMNQVAGGVFKPADEICILSGNKAPDPNTCPCGVSPDLLCPGSGLRG